MAMLSPVQDLKQREKEMRVISLDPLIKLQPFHKTVLMALMRRSMAVHGEIPSPLQILEMDRRTHLQTRNPMCKTMVVILVVKRVMDWEIHKERGIVRPVEDVGLAGLPQRHDLRVQEGVSRLELRP